MVTYKSKVFFSSVIIFKSIKFKIKALFTEMRGEYRFLVINNRMIDTIFIYSVLCAVTAYFNSIILKELFSKSVDTDVLY